jgi:hypothetical protein
VRSETAKMLYGLATATGEKVGQDRIDIYLQALADLPFRDVQKVVQNMILENRFFPKIPDIRNRVQYIEWEQ